MADNEAMQGIESNEGLDDREEVVLASPSVQATVEGETWQGTAEVQLIDDPVDPVVLECLFDQGVEAVPAQAVAKDPGRITRLRVDGRLLAGSGIRATFFDGIDGAKVLVTWRPEKRPRAGIGGAEAR